jgi:hypothetical protein
MHGQNHIKFTLFDVRTMTKSPNDAFLRTYPPSLSDTNDCTVRIPSVILQNICSFSGGCIWSVFVEGVAFVRLETYLQVLCEVVVPAGRVLLLLMTAYYGP